MKTLTPMSFPLPVLLCMLQAVSADFNFVVGSVSVFTPKSLKKDPDDHVINHVFTLYCYFLLNTLNYKFKSQNYFIW